MSKRNKWPSRQSLLSSACASLNPEVLQPTKQPVEKPKNAKYRNKKTATDGIEFDSEKEARRYKELKVLLKKAEIGFLARQVEYVFHLNGGVVASYFADFQYTTAEGILVVEDVKSEITRSLPVYRLKRKMMWLEHKIKINEV